MINSKVGFIGGGNMGRAIAGGLLRGGMHATDLMIAEPLPEQCDILRKELYGIMVTDDNAAVAAVVDTLLFSVKPQILKPVCQGLAAIVQQSRPLIMSIAAGPTIRDIDQWLGGGLSVVRVMPNQPALIDQGISALFANEQVAEAERNMAEKIMSAVGQVVWLEKTDDGYRRHLLLDGVRRVADTQAGDLDGDGDIDLAVAVFGYARGEVLWLENDGEQSFLKHTLLKAPGAIHVPLADFDDDGDLDIVAVVSQDEEEIWGFENLGSGAGPKRFRPRRSPGQSSPEPDHPRTRNGGQSSREYPRTPPPHRSHPPAGGRPVRRAGR